MKAPQSWPPRRVKITPLSPEERAAIAARKAAEAADQRRWEREQRRIERRNRKGWNG